MNSIVIESPGLLTTIQDFGRPGHGPLGISPSGAADPIALHIGNLLVGNEPGAAALEMTLAGGHFQFHQDTVIALTGSDFAATINQRSVATWRSYQVRAREKLSVGATQQGARCYLCIAGKLDVKPFLGSASTHLLSGLGGLQGRALRKGDVLSISKPPRAFTERRLKESVVKSLLQREVLRVTDGPQCDFFAEETKTLFYGGTFNVTEESNRLGLRLVGPVIKSISAREMITEGVTLGAIQITPSGQPIILFVEQQTTGGYPKFTNIIGADLFRIGQLRPRDTVRFTRVSFSEARATWIDLQQLLASGDRLFA
jgi:antagonist of KipI